MTSGLAHAQSEAQAQALQGYPTFPANAKAHSVVGKPPSHGDDSHSLPHNNITSKYPMAISTLTATTTVEGQISRTEESTTNDHDHDQNHAYEEDDDEINKICNPTKVELFGNMQFQRRFILVDDPQRESRVHIRITLDQVNKDEIPDSYRSSNAVYPRSYFPLHMKESGNPIVKDGRFHRNSKKINYSCKKSASASDNVDIDVDVDNGIENFDVNGGDDGDDDSASASASASATIGRTMVTVPSSQGDVKVAVPKISSRRRRTDILVNDLGYRMSWGQSRVFSGRKLFLQRSCKFISSSSSHFS